MQPDDTFSIVLPWNTAGKQILNRHYSDIKGAIASGTVDDTKAVGLLDQWLIEGKYTEEEALVQSCDMLAAGMDTVSIEDTIVHKIYYS